MRKSYKFRNMADGDPNYCLDALKEAAWDILRENPGSDFGDWQRSLIEQFPAETVDALGADPEEVHAALADWWECMDYEDPSTGMCERYRDWAEYFASDRSVELYDRLTEAQGEIRRLEAFKPQRCINPQLNMQDSSKGQI